MKIIHKKTAYVLGSNIKVASLFQKLKGLMFANSFGSSDGLYISWRNSVHNCFVRFPIDVVFIDSEGVIIKILRNFRPWQFSAIYFKARHVVELPAGKVLGSIQEGDALDII